MSDVVDLAAWRALKAGTDELPPREPDFELEGWVVNGELEWILTRGAVAATDGTWSHTEQVALLIDAAWMHANHSPNQRIERGDLPAIWVLLDRNGRSTLLWPKDLVIGTNWRTSVWLLRSWWRISVRWGLIAWKAALGKA